MLDLNKRPVNSRQGSSDGFLVHVSLGILGTTAVIRRPCNRGKRRASQNYFCAGAT
jgi:hypothetical protein